MSKIFKTNGGANDKYKINYPRLILIDHVSTATKVNDDDSSAKHSRYFSMWIEQIITYLCMPGTVKLTLSTLFHVPHNNLVKMSTLYPVFP